MNTPLRGRVVRLFVPYRLEVLGVVACVFMATAVGALPPLLLQRIVDKALPERDLPALIFFIGIMTAAAAAGSGLLLLESRFSVRLGEGVMRDIRRGLMLHMLKLPLAFYRRTLQGQIVTRVTADIDNIEDVCLGTVNALVTSAVVMTVSAIMMVLVDANLALVAFGVLAFGAFPLTAGGRAMYAARRATREQRDGIEAVTQEAFCVGGVAAMKAFNGEAQTCERHRVATARLASAEIALAMTGRVFMAVITVVRTAAPAAVWLVGATRVFAHEATVGSLIAFIMYFTRFSTEGEATATVFVQLSAIRSLFERIFEFLDEQPDTAGGREFLPDGPLDVTARDLRVKYGALTVLHIRDLYIAPGTLTVLVGPSGAGKSTFANVLLGLIPADHGTVRIGNVPVDEIERGDLRRATAIIPQDPMIFNASLRDNVAYGIDATDREIFDALVAANLSELLGRLPEQLGTILGEAGFAVSSGERQRIAIARAAIRRPRLLIYDEATSALDAENERLVLEALRRSCKDCTAIVIAHRYTALAYADEVISIERGEVIAAGDLADILKSDALFAARYNAAVGDRRPALADVML